MTPSTCPHCGGSRLYRSREVSAAGGHAPDFLPGLGRFLAAEKFNLMLCQDCGLMRFFARKSAREKLPNSNKWERM